MKNPIVVLLAGGRSERFWPLSQKNLLPFLGEAIIYKQIKSLQDAGFNDLVIISNKVSKNAVIHTGVKAVLQKGTGMSSALLSASDYIKGRKLLVVISNDLVEKKFFKVLYSKIQKTKNNFLVTYKPHHYMPMGYITQKDGRITNIVEKPQEGSEPSSEVTISSHFYQDGDKLLSIINKTKSNKDNIYEKAITHMIEKGEIFEPVHYTGLYAYLKYPWHTLLAMNFFLSSIKSKIAKGAVIDKSAKIQGPVWIERGVRVMENAKIVGPTFIGRNTIVGNNTMIRASHIGQHCVIGFGSDVTRSYVGDLCWLHTNYIGDSVLGENVSMGAGTVLANLRLDERAIFSMVRGKKISSRKDKFGSIIGNNVRIGVNTSIMPGVKIGQNCFIGAGIILNKDLENNKRLFIRQTHTIKDQSLMAAQDKRQKFRMKI